MEVTLDDDQEFFRDTTVRFLAAEAGIREVRRLADEGSVPPASFWRQGAELGWTSLLVPESHGGGSISGNGVVDLTIVADAFGHHVAPGPLGPTNVVAAALARSTSDAHAELLGGLLAGDAVATWCGSEHALGEGSTTVAGSSGGWVLSGRSVPVEAASQSTSLLVTALGSDGLEQFVVPTDADGVTVTPLSAVDTVRRFDRVDFDGVSVPPAAMLEASGSVASQVERQLQDALVVESAQMVGAAQQAFDITREWLFDRYSFGRPLASYQALKHRFADMKMWLEASHALVSSLAREVHDGAPGASETASITKAYLGHHLAELVHECVQMHGGIGLTVEHDLHLYLRRVATGRALFGTPAVHRQRIAAIALADTVTNGEAA